jgi:hypothetical protein
MGETLSKLTSANNATSSNSATSANNATSANKTNFTDEIKKNRIEKLEKQIVELKNENINLKKNIETNSIEKKKFCDTRSNTAPSVLDKTSSSWWPSFSGGRKKSKKSKQNNKSKKQKKSRKLKKLKKN